MFDPKTMAKELVKDMLFPWRWKNLFPPMPKKDYSRMTMDELQSENDRLTTALGLPANTQLSGHPRMPDQRSLEDQLDDLEKLAVKAGLYDAHDWVKTKRGK